jgi:hypothetical protein
MGVSSMKYELEKIWKEAVVSESSFHPIILLEENTRNILSIIFRPRLKSIPNPLGLQK